MKNKNVLKRMKKEISFKSQKYCLHCGGILKFLKDEVSCFMCGRDIDHFCTNCLISPGLLKQSA